MKPGEEVFVFCGLAVFPLSLFVTMFMIMYTVCYVDQCTFDTDPLGQQTMMIALGVYHGWLWITGAVLYLAKRKPGVKAFLAKEIHWEVTRGQVVLGAWITALLIFNTVFWHNTFAIFWETNDSYIGFQNITQYRIPTQVSQQTGRLNEILLGLALLPVSRNSILDKVFDVSFVNAIAFHRVIGWVFVLNVSIHALSFTYGASQYADQTWQSFMFNFYDEEVAESMAASNLSYLDWGNGMYMNEMGVIGYLVMLPAAFFSLAYFRRGLYNVFYSFHMLFHVMIVFAWLHATSNFYYSLPGVGLYIIDITMRLFHRLDTLSYLTVAAAKMDVGGKLRIDFDVNGFSEFQNLQPEEFIRICIPAVTGWEWHPFTLIKTSFPTVSVVISTAPSDPKMMNWSKKVATHLTTKGKASNLVAFEGPFKGDAFDSRLVSDKRILFLVAGSGITPVVGIVASNPNQHALVWSVRLDAGEPNGTAAQSSLLEDIPGRVAVVIHETRPDGSLAADNRVADQEHGVTDPSTQSSKKGNVTINSGRVDFGNIVQTYLKNDEFSAVFVCGPTGFRKDAVQALGEFKERKITMMVGSFEL